MRNIAVLAIGAMLLAGSAAAQSKPVNPVPLGVTPLRPAGEPTLESAKRIERDQAIKLVREKKAVFVDVRPKESYDAGHIKGSLSIPEFELISRLKEIPQGRMIITYCA